MTTFEVVRVLMVTPEEKIAVCQRIPDAYEGGKWCLFGGKAENGNLFFEAIREVQEEAGIRLDSLGFLRMVANEVAGKRWKQYYFWTRINPGDIYRINNNFRRQEILSVDYVGTQELPDKEFAFGDNVIVHWFLTEILPHV